MGIWPDFASIETIIPWRILESGIGHRTGGFPQAGTGNLRCSRPIVAGFREAGDQCPRLFGARVNARVAAVWRQGLRQVRVSKRCRDGAAYGIT